MGVKMEENKFWISDVKHGRGTLSDFEEEYRKLNSKDKTFATASQIFPIFTEGYSSRDEKNGILYEWMIYFKSAPVKGIPITLTDKEGNKMCNNAPDNDYEEDYEENVVDQVVVN